MQENRLSRRPGLRIPRQVKNEIGAVNTMDDLFATRKAVAMANDKKFRPDENSRGENDADLELVSKIPADSSELIVITKAKKLGAYILAVTMKSPAKFRGVFVNRMQNFCLDAVQDLLNANFILLDTPENKKSREDFQVGAVIKLKMLAYISMVAENAGCILARQYKQISQQTGEVINLAAAWKKSDDEKWRNKL